MRSLAIAAIGVSIAVAATVAAQRSTAPMRTGASIASSDATTRIVASAQAVLNALDEAGRAKIQYSFDNNAQKTRWSNLPSPMFQRTGLRLADVTPAQRTAVMTLLSVALSRDGYRKVQEIMNGDEVLRQTGSGPPGLPRGAPPNPGGAPPAGRAGGGGRAGGPVFGQDEYYLAFVGTPSTRAPWMLQFGGHHLAINLTMDGSDATMAPSLPAAQPATYTLEGRTVRPLGQENDKGFALINALDADQRKQAILGYRVADLVLGPGQDGRTIQPEGIRASALSDAQRTMLWDLAREWIGIVTDTFAEPRMAEIRSHAAETYFAWSGPTTNGSAAYFRIQGPTLVIEYAPQSSIDHIHTIYRDPTNDYGAKFARR
jgi:hypothetical protein